MALFQKLPSHLQRDLCRQLQDDFEVMEKIWYQIEEDVVRFFQNITRQTTQMVYEKFLLTVIHTLCQSLEPLINFEFLVGFWQVHSVPHLHLFLAEDRHLTKLLPLVLNYGKLQHNFLSDDNYNCTIFKTITTQENDAPREETEEEEEGVSQGIIESCCRFL